MNQKHLLLIPFLFLLFVSSCNQKSKKNIALIIDDKEIYVEQIDKLIEEPLTRILEGIYILRQGAINEYIDNFVLKVEAEKKGISIENLLREEVINKITDSLLNAEAERLGYNIPDRTEPFKIYSFNSEFGKEYLRESLILKYKQEYAEKLKLNHSINIKLQAFNKNTKGENKENSPNIDTLFIDNLNVVYRGNDNSRIKILFIGDYECDGCLKTYPIVESLYRKYQNDAKFGFIYYNPNPSLAAKAAEASTKQNLFWDMHTVLFNMHASGVVINDTSAIMNAASKINLDKKKLLTDIESDEIYDKMHYNFEILQRSGIHEYPIIIINNHIFKAPFSETELDSYIHQLIYN